MNDLERAFKALQGKQYEYTALWDYYEGSQPLRYSTERLNEVFKNLNTRFVQNWCAVVVDAAIERLQLTGFTVSENEEAEALLNSLFVTTELNLDSDDAHLAALVCGEAFVIIWPDETGATQAYYNDPRLCHVFYQPDNPREKRYAAKWFEDDDGRTHLTLYYPDHLEYYIAKSAAGSISAYTAFQADDPDQAPNPFGMVPVFHLRRSRRGPQSELANVLGPQDAINKLLADMMVAAEFGAFKQRWVISQAPTKALKNSPNQIWDLPAGDGAGQQTQVGEFGETPLGNYLDAIDRLSQSVGVISRTPKHYFFSQSGAPSGEALIAMEAPLNKKVERIIELFSATWRKVAVFLLELNGVTVPEFDIEPVFDTPSTVQPMTAAQIRVTDRNAGIPLTTILKREGWSQAELDQMAEDKREDEMQSADLARAYMEQARRQFDQEQTEGVQNATPA